MSAPVAAASNAPTDTRDRLGHVRWIGGGTGCGKSTIARIIARRHDVDLYSGDRAEHDWLTRATPQEHPHLAALADRRPGDSWRDRSPRQAFDVMPGRHGETVDLLVEDLASRPRDRVVLVDYFGVLPRDLAPRLSRATHAVLLVPTPDFRRSALARRYADPERARANWGDLDPAEVLRLRLERDALWDAEVTDQAGALGLPVRVVDGTRSAEEIADEVADGFGLGPAR